MFYIIWIKANKVKFYINKKSNIAFHTLTINNINNDQDLLFYNFINSSFIYKKKLKNIFLFLKPVNKISENKNNFKII